MRDGQLIVGFYFTCLVRRRRVFVCFGWIASLSFASEVAIVPPPVFEGELRSEDERYIE